MCFLNGGLSLKVLEHLSHLNGLSSEWVAWWYLRLAIWLNAFLQMSHTNGLSPVCMRMCCLRMFWVLKDLRHRVQACFMPESFLGAVSGPLGDTGPADIL
ncbi:hypothetical protein BpHYR1_011117 [Brachionus plicatilis]|uniref:Uncharacterized protein n=1 Tax=Brachionus plicatilis TaxID=10195 RepID=A0A3M7RAQ8_BRAPC|nr:hypothetical protein BpHYR1_011117 [Brachionus plicatilis]